MRKIIKYNTFLFPLFIIFFNLNFYANESHENENSNHKYSLGEVYNLALQNDQQIRIAYNNLKSSKFTKFANLSPLFPQVSFYTEYQTGNRDLSFPGLSFSTGENSRLYNFSLNQIVFNYGLIQSYIKSKYDFFNQEMSFYNSQQNLLLDVALKYFNIIKAQNNLISQEEEYKSIQQQYKQTDAQYKVGIVAKVDLDDVTAKLATSKTRVITSKTLVKNAVDELEVLTNTQIKKVNKYNHKKEIYKYNLNYNNWLIKAKDNNFSIKQSLYNALSINTNVKIATSDFLPTISFSGSYIGQKYNPSNIEFNHTKVFMLNVTYPFFSSGNTYFTRKQAVQYYQQAKHDYEQVYREETTKVDINIRNIKTDIARIKSLKQELKSQKTALDAARAGYEVGTRTMSEVLDQLSSYYVAQTEYFNSFYDYFLDTLKLKQVAGELNHSDISVLDEILTK